MMEPVVERLAEEKGIGQNGRGVAFAKIEISGMGSTLAGQYRITATPTFLFFLDGEKVCLLYSFVKKIDSNHGLTD
jgi:thioredoxin-related protein